MEYPWIKNMTTEDKRLCVSFDGIESNNDGDTCISCATHYLLKDLSGAVCIDVGADMGWWGRFCKYINHTNLVYAFEPNPASFSILNRQSSDTFRIFNRAVSDKAGEVHMDFQGSNSNSRGSTGTLVKTTKLDFIFDSVRTVDIIKIDTEGHDITIVKSLEPFFPRINTIIFEFTVYWSGADRNECIQNSLNALELVYDRYPYVYIASRRSFPKLFRITDMDNLMPIILTLMQVGLQVDIVCSVTAVASIEVLEDTLFLENFTVVV
jgi:FkbM family methyltransferase